MRILQEIEKKYNSIDMNYDSSKEDLKYMDSHYKFSTKPDYLTPTLILVGVVLMVLGIVMIFKVLVAGIISVLIGACAIVGGIFLFEKKKTAKQGEFLKHYESSIIQNGKIKYNDAKAFSSLYPAYVEVDNEMKTFKIIYHDKDSIFCEYDDILNYRLLVNEEEIASTRLDDNIDSNIKSYILEITFNNKKKSQIKFYNENSKFKLGGNYNYSIASNAKAINSIANVMDMIIMKNVVNLDEI